MIKKLELFTGDKTYMYPNGEVATPERVCKDFPAVKLFPHMVETDEAGQVLFAIQNLAAMHAHYDLEVPQEALDLTEAMQEKYSMDQAAWQAEVKLNTAQAMLDQPLPPPGDALETQDMMRQIQKTTIEVQRHADVETATAELKEAKHKQQTATKRYAACIGVMRPVLSTMEEVINTPVPDEMTVTAEDRIAAALELLCLMNMPDM